MKKLKLFILFLPVVLMFGCARFGTKQTDVSYENGKINRSITTKASAFTFFSAKSSLANWKASQTDKTQGATVGGLNQEADAAEKLVPLVQAFIEGAIKGAIKATVPVTP